MADNDSKTCSGPCKQLKSPDGFYKTPKSRDGLSYICKQCTIERSHQWAKNHPKAAAQRVKDWLAANPERAKANYQRYYETHKAVITQRVKEWRQANPEK